VTKGDAAFRAVHHGLMMLAASLGSSIELAAQGPDAPEAVNASSAHRRQISRGCVSPLTPVPC